MKPARALAGSVENGIGVTTIPAAVFPTPPSADDLAVGHDGRLEHAVAAGDDGLRVFGGERGAAVLIAQQKLVEPGQGMDFRAGGRRRIQQPGGHPVAGAVDDDFLQFGPGDRQPGGGVRSGSFVHQVKSRSVAGPWLTKNRRTNSPRASSRSRCRASAPIPQQHHRLLVAPHRTEAQVAGLVQPSEQMHSALPGGVDPGRLERGHQLGPGGGSTALEQPAATFRPARRSPRPVPVPDDGWSATAACGRRSDPSIQPMSSPGTRCRVPRIGQDRMISPRAKARRRRPGRGTGRPQPDRPFGTGQVLALHGQHPADHLRRAGERAALDSLRGQAAEGGSRWVGRHRDILAHPPRTTCRNRWLTEKRHGPRRGRHRGPCWTIPAQCASRHVVALGD